MLDPGRYFAEAIYFMQYALAQILWTVNRATLSIAVIAESINTWVTNNVGYFVQLLVNALSAPLGGMFILALTALGFWYVLNNIIPTNRWVDPSKLFSYGLITFFFFSSPIMVVDLMEALRQSLNAGIDAALIDGATGDIFTAGMNGTDTGLPGAIPDVNSDGVIGSFDLVAAFILVANINELDSSEFPVDFEAAFFPFGDPSGINLSDEADQELAKALANDGIERLFFSLVAIPTAIAEHFLHLSLTGVAIFLYLGVPIAMLFAFFVYTQAFLGAYLRQFINLLIETFMSVIITAVMIGLLVAAARQGIGLYIGAGIIALIVLLWRIKSALKLAAAAFDLFGGAVITGGVGGMELAYMGKQAVAGTVGLAGAALTGGATLAAGSAMLASAAALQADGRAGGAYMGADPHKTDGRVRQLKTIAGYTLGQSETTRSIIEGTHEVRTLARNFRDGEVQPYAPDTLDYLRAGSSMSGFGSSPWLAMRVSPSLRAAYDQIGGRRHGDNDFLLDDAYDTEGEPVGINSGDDHDASASWRGEPATPRQLAALHRLGVDAPERLTRGRASDLINQARPLRPRPATADSLAVDYPAQTADLANETGATDTLAHRFADLEQALAALTAALTGAEGAGRRASGPAVGPAVELGKESVNGPVPEWLREAEAPPDAGANPDAGGDAGSDKVTGRLKPAVHSVHFEPIQAPRRQAIHDALERLEDPRSLAGQAAYKMLLVYTGEHNAGLIQSAVNQHSTAAVQQAAAATAGLVTQYHAQGMDDAAVLAAFQSGEAAAAIRKTLIDQDAETPLSDAQLSAVADMVLLPQRRLTRAELVTVIGQQAAARAADERAVARAVHSPVGFGAQTGNVRGVMAGARAMHLSPAELARMAEMIQDGLRELVQAELTGRGYRPEMVHDFVSDMAALPGVMVIPQTTAVSFEEE